MSGVPILDENGIIVGSMGIHYDMTERKQLEHELARAKRFAEEAQQAEKQFFGKVLRHIHVETAADPAMKKQAQNSRCRAPNGGEAEATHRAAGAVKQVPACNACSLFLHKEPTANPG